MIQQCIVQGIFVAAGLVSLLAALLNWNWFFNAGNTQLIVRNIGRQRARLFYGVLGIILISMAIYFFIATREALLLEA